MTPVLCGEIGGNVAEVRLEGEVVRVQILSVVSRQPTYDQAIPFRELTAFGLQRRLHRLMFLPAVVMGCLVAVGPVREEMGVLEIVAIMAVLGAIGFGAARLIPLLRFHIATQRGEMMIHLSPFVGKRANALAAAVHSVRPDLKA